MKLTGLWWWIDRWRKSTAYTDLTLEEQGAYRNLLDEAHLRGGAIPNDERVLAKACGDQTKWRRVRDVVLRRFHLQDDGWHHETLDAVIKESQRRAANQANYRARRDNKHDNKNDNKADNNTDNKAGRNTTNKADSPDPSPVSVKERRLAAADSRSRHPVFKGSLVVVFDWMLADLMAMLGANTEEFDLHAWFYELDKLAAIEPEVITTREQRWKWIQRKTVAEAKRRGLLSRVDDYGQDQPWAWSCHACGEVHQGRKDQYGQCLRVAS